MVKCVAMLGRKPSDADGGITSWMSIDSSGQALVSISSFPHKTCC